jgi:CRP/FNR family cyclic AMP-dependent transcriptional regulator
VKKLEKFDLVEAHQVLSNCFLFRGLKAEERHAIVNRAHTRTFKVNETIFTIGSPGDNMMAVLSGNIRISVPAQAGRELVLAILHPGEVFGELAVLDGKERSAEAVASTSCTLAILDRRDILTFLEHHPAVWSTLVGVLCDRLRRADQLVADVALLQLPARLAKLILRIIGEETPSTADFIVRFSQRELANMLGGTRERVNKCIAEWQREGIVKARGGTIIVLNKAALEKISELG